MVKSTITVIAITVASITVNSNYSPDSLLRVNYRAIKIRDDAIETKSVGGSSLGKSLRQPSAYPLSIPPS